MTENSRSQGAGLDAHAVALAKSVSPAGRARIIGPRTYADASRDRIIAAISEGIAAAGYVVYLFYPLPTSLPRTFPWPWPISILIAVLIAVPAGALMANGIRDAGEEAMRPKPEHQMYRGIYRHIRHPQAAGARTIAITNHNAS